MKQVGIISTDNILNQIAGGFSRKQSQMLAPGEILGLLREDQANANRLTVLAAKPKNPIKITLHLDHIITMPHLFQVGFLLRVHQPLRKH